VLVESSPPDTIAMGHAGETEKLLPLLVAVFHRQQHVGLWMLNPVPLLEQSHSVTVTAAHDPSAHSLDVFAQGGDPTEAGDDNASAHNKSAVGSRLWAVKATPADRPLPTAH